MNEFEDKKEDRKKRKLAQNQDRSKYKKSVKEKHIHQRLVENQQRIENEDLKKGRVMSIFSEHILVYSHGKTIRCTLRGILKKEMTENKNIVIVGDLVLFSALNPMEGVIWHAEPRYSLLAKRSKEGQRQQLIAANLDQVILVASADDPPFDLAYMDRALIATLRGGMNPVVVINKVDLPLSDLVKEIIVLYSSLHIPLFLTSTKNGEGLEGLQKKNEGKSLSLCWPFWHGEIFFD